MKVAVRVGGDRMEGEIEADLGQDEDVLGGGDNAANAAAPTRRAPPKPKSMGHGRLNRKGSSSGRNQKSATAATAPIAAAAAANPPAAATAQNNAAAAVGGGAATVAFSAVGMTDAQKNRKLRDNNKLILKYKTAEAEHKQDMKVKEEQLKEKDREMEEMKQKYEKKLDRKEEELNTVTKRSFADRKAANVVSFECV